MLFFFLPFAIPIHGVQIQSQISEHHNDESIAFVRPITLKRNIIKEEQTYAVITYLITFSHSQGNSSHLGFRLRLVMYGR